MTKALQQLEQHSGVRLLQRTTRQINLTPEGEDFYQRSKPLLAQADDLLESFAPDRPLSGQLRVDMPISFAALRVVPNLPDFYRMHPNIEIILSCSDRRRNMLREGLDCVLRMGELEDGDYISRPLGNIDMLTCASPAYLAAHGRLDTLEDLQHHQAVNWVNSSSRQSMPWIFKTETGTTEIHPPGKLVMDNSEAYIVAGLAGLGLLQGMRFFYSLISTVGDWSRCCLTIQSRTASCRYFIHTATFQERYAHLLNGLRHCCGKVNLD